MPEINNIPTKRYYPTLSSVVTEEDIPDILGFLKDGISNLLKKVHFKDLQFSKSARGDAAFYSLSIVTKDRLDIEVPGTGIFLILNPDIEGEDIDISSFPITIEYQWQLLAYVRSFNLEQFDFSPKAFFETALIALSISEEQAVANFINTFTEPINGNSSLQQFVEDLNNYNSSWNLVTPTQETTITNVVQDIYTKTEDYATIIAFGKYILNNDLGETKQKLKEFFKNLLPQDIEEYIKNILIPKFKATLLLRAGLEFPRSILKPVYPENSTDPYPDLEIIPEDDQGNPKVVLSFGEALFYADTENGFGYNMDVILNTSKPAMIGNTGLIINIRNLKIDLSTKENIVEADLDNRPPEFMGVYTERTDIILPKKWFDKETSQTLAITGEKLLIGTGGISGTIALRATYAVDDNKQVTDYYSEYFNLDYSTSVTVLSNQTEISITSDENLLTHINSLESPYDLKFKYPLTIITSTGNKTFENEEEYNDFINLIDPNQFIWFKLGSNPEKAWRLGFNRFDLTFHHGQVVESNLKARLEIPKFNDPNKAGDEKATIDLDGHWYSSEDFSLTASFLQDPLRLNLFNFVNINFVSVEIGKDDDRFFLGTACEITFENAIMKKVLGDQKIILPRVRIYDDGSMEIVGGNAFIPTNISLNLGPIEMAVTGIHFGSYQQEDSQGRIRKYNYWGFDGAISLDPLGIDARGEGVKYYYTVDNDEFGDEGDNFLRIQTIEVNLVIPGSASPGSALAIISGMLSIPQPGESPEYIGKVSLKLPKAKIAGSAAMALQPKYPAFVVDANIDLPAPIPIGPLGIYGFRGLLGFRYVAEKEAVGLISGEDTWYDYYTYPPKGVDVSKFSGPERTEEYDFPVSLGAGAVLGTSFDSGTVISVRAMLLLSLPSLFLVEGKASILSARLGLDDNREPPFFAFVAWGDNSIEMGMGADFKLPQNSGWIMSLYADVQAGFFFNGQKSWYVNFGTKENPVTARILTIVTAQSYLMLSASGIEAGARVEFNLRKRFGPAKVHIYAYLEMGGFISFERPQIGGYLALGGKVDIDIWIVGVTIGLDAIFSVEAPKPFLIYAEIRLRACVKILWVRICKSFTVKIKLGRENKLIDRNPIPALPYENGEYSSNRTKELVQGVNMLTNESFELDFIKVDSDDSFVVNPNITINSTIPLDTYIDIKTAKGLNPSAVSTIIGGHTGRADNFIDLIPPNKVIRGGKEIRQVKHKYSIVGIEIKALSASNEWVDYHPFEALVKSGDRSKVSNLRIGYWQRTGNQYDAIRLLATNPFSYTEAGEPGWLVPEEYGVTPSELFCKSEEIAYDCTNFLNKDLDTVYYPPQQYIGHFINGAYFTLEGNFETSVNTNEDGTQNVTISDDNFRIKGTPNDLEFDRFSDFNKSLEFDNGNNLVIILPSSSVEVSLKLTTYGEDVTIRYYKSDGLENNNTIYSEIGDVTKTASELSEEITYSKKDDIDNKDILISKIVIETKNKTNGGIGFMQIQNPESRNEKAFEVGKQVNNQVGAYYYTTSLQEICWMTVENKEYNLTIPEQEAVEKEQKDMVAASQKTIQPIWRPNTKYYIRFRLKDEVDNGANEGIFDYYYGFKTAGPVGHYHKDSDVDYLPTGANPDQYPLTSLRQYIDYERSYPNADGSLLQAKPLFYGHNECKIAIYFSRSLTYHMLSKWEAYNGLPELAGNMHIAIKDPITDMVIPYPLPADFDKQLIPNEQAFATLLEVDWIDISLPPNNEELEVPQELNIIDKDGQLLGNYKVLFSELDNRFIRIDDEAALSDNLDLIGGKIQWEVSDANIEQTILNIGKEENANWNTDNNPRIPAHLQLLNNMVNHINENNDVIKCNLKIGKPIVPNSYSFNTTLTNLQPSKLYTALIYNAFDKDSTGLLENTKSEEVHQFVFQTSKYKDFERQVKSYWLQELDNDNNVLEEKQAVFEVILDVSDFDIATAYNIVAGNTDTNSDSLEFKYYHLFDRAIEGALNITPINPPENTEFNILKNINTDKTIGILIRNPEPFNIPKIPLEDIQGSISVVDASSGAPDNAYKVLYSKDYSQALIMHNSKEITANTLNFNFQYKIWNGSEYVKNSDVLVENILIKKEN
ncbi:hypothetical protein JL193_07180 [Polaribacter batillariae]|uniref:Uncharacterized protein n=1 Tax=Polaribacter batillariae TaxID=2808900 RepID=A0ABX7SXP3_9FLAO|nr:hypothetical protein [Polaribacter batillariae]QTD39024.1 hypothetical protein JL193_07180 [Polaribacter batillariae]